MSNSGTKFKLNPSTISNQITVIFVVMNDGDIIGVLSDFLYLVLEVYVGKLIDVTLLEIVNRF